MDIAKGSLGDMGATGPGLGKVFGKVKIVVAFDNSVSMSEPVISDGLHRTKFAIANEALAQLQRHHPGEIAVISFNDDMTVCIGGILNSPRGSTYLMPVLSNPLIMRAMQAGIVLCIISDGLVADPTDCLKTAAKMIGRIDTMHIGDDDEGKAFLGALAHAREGRYRESDILSLEDGLEKLYLGSGQ